MPTSADEVAPKTGAIVVVVWGEGERDIRLTARNWQKVKNGIPLRIRGKGYHYEGDFFWDYWNFAGGLDGDLLVEYGNDGGVGFDGRLSDADIEEVDRHSLGNAA